MEQKTKSSNKKRFIIAFIVAYFSILVIGIIYSLAGQKYSLSNIAVAILYTSVVIIPICFIFMLNFGHRGGMTYGLGPEIRDDVKFMRVRKFRNPLESVLWAVICASFFHALTIYLLLNYVK
ncbi:MAG: hypothetical protein HY781_05580 [Chloroflexi bacterium]|nr:hypothetical protein [Chloroflexota bacterium]